MAPERMELSAKERDRLKVLHEVERGHLKRAQAARCMHLQVRLRAQVMASRLKTNLVIRCSGGPETGGAEIGSLGSKTN
jgi:hypothetical protein